MLKTGDTCMESGYYKCNVHTGNLLYFEKGNKCPECSSSQYGGSHRTLWGPARKVSHILSELKASQMNSVNS
jgi:hypothetical protein